VTRTELPGEATDLRRWRILLAVSLIVFVGIALEVLFGEAFVIVDQQMAQRLVAHGPDAWTLAMQWLARLHGVAGIAVVGALWAAWLGWRGETVRLATLALIVGGGLALNGLLKQVFQRHRPVFDDSVAVPLDTLATYSFPSGHVSGSVVFYGFVLMGVFARTAHRGWRCAAVLAACAMVALIAYNRLYVGAHFVSDVLAALAEGLAWFAFCVLLLERWRCRPAA
jgi:undecaprenyl-diphosphatase